jgi:hypothetical protein
VSNTNVASTGRFSSQILTYLGTQKVVKNVTGQPENTFTYAMGPTTYIPVDSQYDPNNVAGSFSPDNYNFTRCYFLSRGASAAFADSLASIIMDISTARAITPQTLLDTENILGKLSLSNDSIALFNQLRDPSHQISTVTTAINADSLVAREIKA